MEPCGVSGRMEEDIIWQRMTKKLAIILFLGLSLNLSAQKREAWKTIAVYSSSIVLNAVGDALNDGGHKQAGHLCNALSVGVLLTSPFVIDYEKSKFGWYLTSYTFLRIGLFDYTYNIARGLPYNYIGTTSTWDKFLQQMQPPDGFLTGRIVIFSVGFAIPFNEIYKNKWR